MIVCCALVHPLAFWTSCILKSAAFLLGGACSACTLLVVGNWPQNFDERITRDLSSAPPREGGFCWTVLASGRAVMRRSLCSSPKDLANVERMLAGASAVADRLLASGNTAKGCKVLSQVVAGLRELRGPKHPDTIGSIASLAQALSRSGGDGSLAQAEILAREAADAASEVHDGDRSHPDVSLTRATLAHVLVRRSAFGAAEGLMRTCHEVANEAAAAGGKTASLETQIAASNLAQVLVLQQRLPEALPFAREALRASIEVLGTAHEHTLDELGSLASLLVATGEVEEAEAVLRQRLQTSRDVHGDAHGTTLVALSQLARFLAERAISRHPRSPERAPAILAEAEMLMREDLGLSRHVYGEGHCMETLAALSNLAQLLYEQVR